MDIPTDGLERDSFKIWPFEVSIWSFTVYPSIPWICVCARDIEQYVCFLKYVNYTNFSQISRPPFRSLFLVIHVHRFRINMSMTFWYFLCNPKLQIQRLLISWVVPRCPPGCYCGHHQEKLLYILRLGDSHIPWASELNLLVGGWTNPFEKY